MAHPALQLSLTSPHEVNGKFEFKHKYASCRMSHFRHQKLFSGDISMEESDERGINYPKNGLLGFFGTDLWDMHLLWNMSAHIKNVIIWETVRCFSAWALCFLCPPTGGWLVPQLHLSTYNPSTAMSRMSFKTSPALHSLPVPQLSYGGN